METIKTIQEALEKKISLDNGEVVPMVMIIDEETPAPKYICHVCYIPPCNALNLLSHLNGKQHNRAKGRVIFSQSYYSRMAKLQGTDVPKYTPRVGDVDLAPGEPVPPGFEDEVTPVLMGRLKAMRGAIIGLEFVVELTAGVGDEEPRYRCLLCDKKGDKRTVLAHLISFNHRIRYLTRYFPKAHKALEAVPDKKDNRRGISEVLATIVKAIETKFGRMQPVIANHAEEATSLEDMYQAAVARPHFQENGSDEYAAMVDLALIKDIADNPHKRLTIDEEFEESKRLSASPRTSIKHVAKIVEKMESKPAEPEVVTILDKPEQRRKSVSPISSLSSISPSRPAKSRSRSLISLSKSRSRSRSRSRGRRNIRRSPARRPAPYRRTKSRSRSPVRSRYRRRYSPYRSPRRSPRKSPVRRTQYSPKRYNKRPSRYSPARSRSPTYRRQTARDAPSSARPVVSFKIKSTPSANSKEIAEENERKEKFNRLRTYTDALKTEMGQKLKLYEKTPEKHPQYSEEWKKFWNKRYKELMAEGKDASKHDFKPEWIKFWTVRIKELNEEEIKTRIKTFRAEIDLPEEISEIDDDVVEVSPTPLSAKEKEVAVEEEEITVISVLRLMTALEEQLGSLGPRVNTLLSKALSIERLNKGGADQLLNISENSVLFDTVKEKLKGQLFAGIVERHLIKGTKKAISAIADLFNQRETKKKKAAAEASAKAALAAIPAEPVLVAGVGAVDKMAIAQLIATTLVSQGRTDLTDDDLEQLIGAVVGMAQASATKPEPVKEKSSSLHELLSTVVKAHTAATTPTKVVVEETMDVDPNQLNENDLTTLFKNFQGLSEAEKKFLLGYLKDLSEKDPAKVERLEKLMNPPQKRPASPEVEISGRLSPFSSRIGGANPTNEKNSRSFEDDEDDYSIEDVFKAAKNNIKMERAAKKAADKNIAAKLIEEQEKKAQNEKKMVIDPDDLLPGGTANSNNTYSNLPPTHNVPPPHVLMGPPPANVAPATVHVEQPHPLPTSSLGPLLGPINPAPQPVPEPHEWPAYDYTGDGTFSYGENNGYDFNQPPPAYPTTEYQTWQEQEAVYQPEQTAYQQPAAPYYAQQHEEYVSQPSTHYQGYY